MTKEAEQNVNTQRPVDRNITQAKREALDDTLLAGAAADLPRRT